MPPSPPPLAKPAAGSNAATAANTNASNIAPLLSWLRSVGIWWDETSVEIRSGCSGCSGPDLGVFAVTDVRENQLLCVIPRSAILSPRTSQLAAVLEAERLGGGLALTIAVMYEASLGQESKWAGYFASLPPREYLPIFWGEQELQLLQGTGLEGKPAEDRQLTAEDYETHVVPLLQQYPQVFPAPERCSLHHFRVAASWVASRCFYVDAWHGDALVPLADIFNHKASVVLLGDAWGVAEIADADADAAAGGQHNNGQHNNGQHEHEHDHTAGDESEGSEEEEEEDGSEEEEQEEEEEEEEEDAQHGFAVGGMPVIASAAAPAVVAAAGGDGGGDSVVLGGSSGSRWLRDGLNLRLEIGICSMGPPDSREELVGAAAAAAAAANGSSGGSAGAAAGVGDAADKQQPASKRRRVDQEAQQQQQQQGSARQQQQQPPAEWPPEKRLEIVAASAVAAGAEVHNTYGELSNALLVSKYGFCLPLNPFDEVTLCDSWAGFISPPDSSSSSSTSGFKIPAKLKQHVKWLQKHSNLLDTPDEAEDEDAEDADTPDPPLITPGGRLAVETAAVVRLLGASAAQLKAWQGLEDVLSQNPGGDVSDDHGEDAPDAVPLGESAAAAAAGRGGDSNGGSDSSSKQQQPSSMCGQHFDDIRLSDHSVAWWGRAGLELLAAAVQRRLQRYPASLEADRLALAQRQQVLVLPQQEQGLGEGEGEGEGGSVGGSGGAVAASEHAAAVRAALQLRVCEQEALHAVLAGVEGMLTAQQ